MQFKQTIFIIIGLAAMSVAALDSNNIQAGTAASVVATSDASITASPANSTADAKAAVVAQSDSVAVVTPPVVAPITSNDTNPDFEDFQQKNKRRYKNREERRFRFRMYKNTDAFVKRSNSNKKRGWKVGHNQFSDMTDAELQAYLNFEHPSDEDTQDDSSAANASLLSSDRKLDATTPLPASYNNIKLSRKGSPTLSPIRDQGQCGSCWAHALLGAVESALIVKRATVNSAGKTVYPLIDLSEQQIMDCTNVNNDIVGYYSKGCSGGNAIDAARYVIKNGVNTEAEYPYIADDQACNTSLAAPAADTKKFTNTVIKKKSMKSMLDGIKVAPVACALYVTKSLMHYQSGVYDVTTDTDQVTTTTNHAILCTGYDTTTSTPYIEMKNSWGPNWGENGYFRVGIELVEGDEGPANLLNHTGNTYVQVKL